MGTVSYYKYRYRSRCAVLFLMIKILPAESTIPKESRKMVKLNKVSNSLAQNTVNAANHGKNG